MLDSNCYVALAVAATQPSDGLETNTSSTAVDQVLVVRGRRRMNDRPLSPAPHDALLLANRPPRIENLGDVVSELPGVSLVRQGGLGAPQFVSIRGTSFDHAVVLIDDVPVTGPDRGAVDLSLFPIDGFERIELFRGSAPIRYGVGTIGGVIRLVPKQASQPKLKTRAVAASFNTFDAKAEAEAGGPNAGFVAAGGLLHADNDFSYLDDNATREVASDDQVVQRQNAEVLQGHGFFSGSWRQGPHRVAALLFGIHQDRGLPGPANVISLDSSQQRTRFFGSLGYRFEDRWGEVLVDAFATAALGYDEDKVSDIFGRIGNSFEDTEDRYQSIDTRTGLFAEVVPGLQIGATFFYRQDDIWPNNRFATPGDQPSSRDLSVLASEIAYRLELEAGMAILARGSVAAQWTQAQLSRPRLQGIEERKVEQWTPNYRFEGRVDLFPQLSVTGLLSVGHQLPTTLQLFGNRDTVVANIDLEPERSVSADLGLIYDETWDALWLHAEVRGFWITLEDIIVARRSSRNTVSFRNENRGETLGMEGTLAWSLLSLFESTTALTWLDASFDNRGFDVEQPLRVPFTFLQKMAANIDPIGLGCHAKAWVEIDYRSSFFIDSANQIEQPDLLLVDVGLELGAPQNEVSFSIVTRNFTDAQGQDLLGFPLPGRSYELAFSWREIF